MGAHLINGEFQSDKYPTCPPGKVPLSVKDKTAQALLWEYAQRRRSVDAEFSEDLETALRAAGYVPPKITEHEMLITLATMALEMNDLTGHDVIEALKGLGHAEVISESRENDRAELTTLDWMLLSR